MSLNVATNTKFQKITAKLGNWSSLDIVFSTRAWPAQPANSNHVVEPVGPHPGFLAEAVECDNPSSLNPAGNIAASWLFVFFLVNHFENLNSMETWWLMTPSTWKLP